MVELRSGQSGLTSVTIIDEIYDDDDDDDGSGGGGGGGGGENVHTRDPP